MVSGEQGGPSVAGLGVAFAIAEFHPRTGNPREPWSVVSDR